MAKFLAVSFFVLFFAATLLAAPTQPPQQTSETVKPISRCLIPTVVGGHRVSLASDPNKPPLRANHKTYINVCFSIPLGGRMRNVCTTGDSQLDLELHGRDNQTQLKNDVGFIMEYPVPPVTVLTDQTSKIPVMEWQDSTPASHEKT